MRHEGSSNTLKSAKSGGKRRSPITSPRWPTRWLAAVPAGTNACRDWPRRRHHLLRVVSGSSPVPARTGSTGPRGAQPQLADDDVPGRGLRAAASRWPSRWGAAVEVSRWGLVHVTGTNRLQLRQQVVPRRSGCRSRAMYRPRVSARTDVERLPVEGPDVHQRPGLQEGRAQLLPPTGAPSRIELIAWLLGGLWNNVLATASAVGASVSSACFPSGVRRSAALGGLVLAQRKQVEQFAVHHLQCRPPALRCDLDVKFA